MPAGARHNPGVDARRISGRIDAAFVALIIAGCAPTHQHVGSGYATSTTNPVAAFVASLKHIAWKKESTLGDIATASAALVAVLALILAWVQLRGLSRQSRADVLLKLDERWESKDVVVLREEVDRFIKEIQAKAIQQQTLSGHPSPRKRCFPASSTSSGSEGATAMDSLSGCAGSGRRSAIRRGPATSVCATYMGYSVARSESTAGCSESTSSVCRRLTPACWSILSGCRTRWTCATSTRACGTEGRCDCGGL